MKQLFLLCALSLGFYYSQAQADQQDITADEIVTAYIEAIGGADAWTSLESMQVDVSMSQMGMAFSGTVVSAQPNKQRIDIDVMGTKMTQAYDGETAWWISPMMGAPTAQPMPEEMAESMTTQEFEPSFLNYAEKGHSIELLGMKEVDGVETYEIKMVKKDGTEEYHYFDPEYMVPIMTKSVVKSGPSAGATVETYLSGYEEVDSIVMPMQLETKMNGATQFSMTFTNVELNTEVEDDFFSMPTKE